ncbi:hypothetical protein C8D89_11471 [Actinomycetospora cinnamomea]|uniref:Uncharacterized protein n=1 Tax=Actinomycetospora cinnamomea TaxID=663609 RepID=A0A2U1F0W1_9PSEU|nr:hypothetical protein C8D89_11471 [Actinomycetospora cinnamomea]
MLALLLPTRSDGSMICPSCGLDLEWIVSENAPGGGWWECEEHHRWRRSFGGLAPVQD